ncbi:MAG: succinate dehydrogenase, hydrophobic membrane anchor protein [Pseudomonadota bacterium]
MGSEKVRMTTPANIVVGLGSAKEGVGHWWMQRVSSIALMPLTLLFVVPFGQTIGDGYEAVRALYAQPLHALIAILFILTNFWHLAQGLQVVIEDYVEHKGARTLMLLGNTMFCGLCAVAGVFAVAKLAFVGV